MPKKDPLARAICPKCYTINLINHDNTEVTCHKCKNEYNPQLGNSSGANVHCPHCSFNFKLVDFLKTKEGPLEHKMYAKLVLQKDDVKKYEPINDYDLELERKANSEFLSLKNNIPIVPLEVGYNTNQVLKYNYKSWHQMFTPRQLLCISMLTDEIRAIPNPDLKRLFACLLSGVLEFNNVFCSFKGEGTGAVRHMFAHHILKPELMPIEANIWGTPKSSGSFSTLFQSRILRALTYKSNPFELQFRDKKVIKISNINRPLNCSISSNYFQFKQNGNLVYISHGDSSNTEINANSIDIVVTDPPFFDNVHYSQLADFFYYWLNQILNISDIKSTRNIAEVQDTNANRFSDKLSKVFSECYRVLKKEGLLIFTYHHSRHEGWISVHKAIRNAGFVCIQSFPIKAEMSVSMPIQQARTPINLDLILICKKENSANLKLHSDEILPASVEKAKAQIHELSESGIKISTCADRESQFFKPPV